VAALATIALAAFASNSLLCRLALAGGRMLPTHSCACGYDCDRRCEARTGVSRRASGREF